MASPERPSLIGQAVCIVQNMESFKLILRRPLVMSACLRRVLLIKSGAVEALTQRATRAADFKTAGSFAQSSDRRYTPIAWLWAVQTCTLFQPEKPRRTSHTANSCHDYMTRDCSRIRGLRGYHHMIQRKFVSMRFPLKCRMLSFSIMLDRQCGSCCTQRHVF